MNEKIKWNVLLFIDILLFILALITEFYPMYFVVIVLSFFIYKEGNPILFKEFDAKRKEKYQQYKIVQEAANQAVKTKRLFKK